jgi:3-hydroxyacyl-[acyl-carrier-protein] dehydratase
MLSFEEVRELVPQKYPFLFIDKVVELQKENKIVCLKNISANESFFAEKDKGKIFLLASANVRFTKPVFPGDQLLLEINVEKVISSAAIVKAVARVGEKTVSKATLSFGVVEKESLTS